MPNCPTCSKQVYFAEKVTALGKDWHRACLKCNKCSKSLTSGKFLENSGKGYCEKPCYAELFGPKGYGAGGGAAQSYQGFGGSNSNLNH
ncbi:hypothetical protein MIR68_005652 [Amoeboaphelidium protococcarum]|nr:hypothetical protein MIR68_005652 [Amoeboaphelidium protococcarum]